MALRITLFDPFWGGPRGGCQTRQIDRFSTKLTSNLVTFGGQTRHLGGYPIICQVWRQIRRKSVILGGQKKVGLRTPKVTRFDVKFVKFEGVKKSRGLLLQK